ncbi:helix-hairpin-helix domain-containing protein [Candidatus Formimonas warabiya]|uniref:Helix-hairpin-helix DNA-binding motif class 1 domain-containing protein n=1 Tax=Formimonas warabiya TaxID=1761012 RepID=A0A3G1KSE7_FORW1|nr:helix-hairpin-helix domain-containing protein [Candidatus Formimonas warabiya]ATW25366.1 hypothetical protein DCMF_11830 [Candidatus Formimonas warabiya]
MLGQLKKEHFIVFGLMIALFFGAGVTYGKYLERTASPAVEITPAPGENLPGGQEEKAAEPAEVVVYVSGAVQNPGVFNLKEGSRVIDAVNLALPLPEADLNRINLAKKLKDQEQVIVPAQGGTGAGESGLQTGSSVSSSSNGEAGQLININTAGAAELDALPGIGPAKAEAIIQYREENGYFTSLEDIQNVSGIGAATFEKLKDRITI